jgi:hypothetical protein
MLNEWDIERVIGENLRTKRGKRGRGSTERVANKKEEIMRRKKKGLMTKKLRRKKKVRGRVS